MAEVVEEVPLPEWRERLRNRRHNIEEDCDDFKKIIITPVYRGRLAESYERTLNAWQGRPWYSATYSHVQRAATDFVERNEQVIVSGMTYLLTFLLIVLIAMLIFRIVTSLILKSRVAPAGQRVIRVSSDRRVVV